MPSFIEIPLGDIAPSPTNPLISKVTGEIREKLMDGKISREQAGLTVVPEDEKVTISSGVGK